MTPNEVFNVVSEYYGVGVQALKGEKRTKTIAWPRQILMYILRNELRLPFDEVGRLVGGRDHSTVMHADGKVRGVLKSDTVVHKEITEIKKKLLILGAQPRLSSMAKRGRRKSRLAQSGVPTTADCPITR